MSILIDELGRPILLFADQDNKKRTKGIEAYKVSFIDLGKYYGSKRSSISFKIFIRAKRNG